MKKSAISAIAVAMVAFGLSTVAYATPQKDCGCEPDKPKGEPKHEESDPNLSAQAGGGSGTGIGTGVGTGIGTGIGEGGSGTGIGTGGTGIGEGGSATGGTGIGQGGIGIGGAGGSGGNGFGGSGGSGGQGGEGGKAVSGSSSGASSGSSSGASAGASNYAPTNASAGASNYAPTAATTGASTSQTGAVTTSASTAPVTVDLGHNSSVTTYKVQYVNQHAQPQVAAPAVGQGVLALPASVCGPLQEVEMVQVEYSDRHFGKRDKFTLSGQFTEIAVPVKGPDGKVKEWDVVDNGDGTFTEWGSFVSKGGMVISTSASTQMGLGFFGSTSGGNAGTGQASVTTGVERMLNIGRCEHRTYGKKVIETTTVVTEDVAALKKRLADAEEKNRRMEAAMPKALAK